MKIDVTHRSYINSLKNQHLQLGFNYRNDLLKRSVSNYILEDKRRSGIIDKMERLLVELVESVKEIKKTYSYSVDKNSLNIN